MNSASKLPSTRSVAVLLALFLALASCKSGTSAASTNAYVRGDYARAEAVIVEEVARDHKVDKSQLTQVGRAPNARVEDSDQALQYMELSMMRLARNDARGAVGFLGAAQPALDAAWADDWMVYADPKVLMKGDAGGPFRGADYEHILLRVMMAVGELVGDRRELFPRAHQIVEVQEKICTSKYGEAQNYKPRDHYKRVAIGHYLAGVIKEGERSTSEARINFTEALKIEPQSAVLKAAVERTTSGSYAPEGQGVVHVIYLGGQSPTLVATERDPRSEIVDGILRVVLTALSPGNYSALFADDVRVPAVSVHTPRVPPLRVRATALATEATTETLFDVNEVASQQLEANMPMILARNVYRRSLKDTGVKQVADDTSSPFGIGLGGALSFGATAIEQPDLRSWTTLPAAVQVARLPLAAGEHALDLGAGMSATVRVRTFEDAYVLVLQPDLARAGVVLVDPRSRLAPPPASAPAK